MIPLLIFEIFFHSRSMFFIQSWDTSWHVFPLLFRLCCHSSKLILTVLSLNYSRHCLSFGIIFSWSHG
jgi:hypothetical protein